MIAEGRQSDTAQYNDERFVAERDQEPG